AFCPRACERLRHQRESTALMHRLDCLVDSRRRDRKPTSFFGGRRQGSPRATFSSSQNNCRPSWSKRQPGWRCPPSGSPHTLVSETTLQRHARAPPSGVPFFAPEDHNFPVEAARQSSRDQVRKTATFILLRCRNIRSYPRNV